MTHCSDNQNKICLSLSNALFSYSNKIEIDDISGFINESIRQGVVLSALEGLNYGKDNLNYEKSEKVKNTVIKRNLEITWAHKYAAQKLSEAEIPYVVMKGMASAQYYPEPSLRSLGDVDILVPEKFIQKAVEIFCNEGFEISHENHERHIVLSKNSLRIELHRIVTGIPDGEIGKMLKAYFDDIFEKSRGYDGINVPSDFHHLLILLLHTAHHIKESGIGLRHLCDYAVFVNRYTKADFDELYAKKLKNVGLYNFALILIQASKNCFGYPDFPEYKNDVCNQLVCDIFDNGSFGNKNPVNTQQTLFSEKGFIKKANEIVCSNWKSAKRRPLLLPLGYVYFSARFFGRSIVGKREKIDLLSAKKSADERRKLYSALKLFKEEE